MDSIIEKLKYQNQKEWLVNYNNFDYNYLYQTTITFYQEFIHINQINSTKANILIIEENNINFIAAFLASIEAKCNLFLCNSQWKEEEWKQVFNLVIPDVIVGNIKSYESLIDKEDKYKNKKENLNIEIDESLIMIATGGTSGKIKFAIHTWKTLSNSVKGFSQYFEVKSINSCCLLPLYHVSGLMQLMRSFITDGKLNFIAYSTLKKSNFPSFDQDNYFISLVPTQLQYLISKNPQWLSQFKTILLGGAKPWESLLNLARSYQLNLAIVYGMTETASNVVALKTEDFLQGHKSNGQVLNHSKIIIQNEYKKSLDVNQTGIIAIESKSLCLGYYPHLFENNEYFVTDDLGYLDENNYLYILGRNSHKIITGGENVNPHEIENIILSTNLVKDICIIGIVDKKWGEAVTAIYIPINNNISEVMIKNALKSKLASFKHPKYWYKVEEIPRNLQGKINYQKLKEKYSISM